MAIFPFISPPLTKISMLISIFILLNSSSSLNLLPVELLLFWILLLLRLSAEFPLIVLFYELLEVIWVLLLIELKGKKEILLSLNGYEA